MCVSSGHVSGRRSSPTWTAVRCCRSADRSRTYLDGSEVLQECGPVTCTHAVAVHRHAYDRILADIPAAGEEFDQWLGEWLACDQYLSRRIADGTFRAIITSPRVATQPFLLGNDDADRELADRYVI